MEKVIHLLSEIEEKAELIVRRVGEEKGRLNQQLEQDIKNFNKQTEAEKENRLLALKVQTDKNLETEKRALIEDCNKQIKHLDEYYKKNHDSLVEKVLAQIIS